MIRIWEITFHNTFTMIKKSIFISGQTIKTMIWTMPPQKWIRCWTFELLLQTMKMTWPSRGKPDLILVWLAAPKWTLVIDSGRLGNPRKSTGKWRTNYLFQRQNTWLILIFPVNQYHDNHYHKQDLPDHIMYKK